MKPLPESFKYDGYNYLQVVRENNLAIYRQSKGPVVHFEVIIIEVIPERETMGMVFPEHEKYPAAESWGIKGWTCSDLDEAWNRFRKVKKELEDKKD